VAPILLLIPRRFGIYNFIAEVEDKNQRRIIICIQLFVASDIGYTSSKILVDPCVKIHLNYHLYSHCQSPYNLTTITEWYIVSSNYILVFDLHTYYHLSSSLCWEQIVKLFTVIDFRSSYSYIVTQISGFVGNFSTVNCDSEQEQK
jgi:hypothetical protein